MSDDKKPKKDLRARLGRTIAPNTPGAPAITTPIVGKAPVAAPPGDVAAPPADVAAPAITPPAIAAPPAITPPSIGGGKSPFGGADIAPPPFAQPAAAAEPAKPKPPSDPFAAGAASPNVVRIEFDERAVSDVEVGRQQRGRGIIVAVVCLLVGGALGAGAGSMNGRRVIHNLAVRDGHEVYDHVNTASTVVLEAQTHIDAIVRAASGGTGGTPAVAYEEIQALQAMENPFPAEVFSRLNYSLFAPATVDDLFHYYNNVTRLWERIERIAGRTLPESRRPELDRTAAALGENASAIFGAMLTTPAGATTADAAPGPDGLTCPSAASAMFGLVLSNAEGQIVAQLAFIEPVTEDGNPTSRVLARGTRTGAGREFELFTGSEEITDSPTHVLLVDGAGSRGVLSEQAGAFTDYVRDLQELHDLMEETVQVQGELTTALSELHNEEEIFTF